MKPSTGWPLVKAITAGIDWMPSWPGICGCSSMFILTSLTLPPAAFTAFSITGVSCLHGPHHGAQKSTSTGCFDDSWMTSWRNAAVVVSLTSPAAAAGVSASIILCLWTAVPGKGNLGRRWGWDRFAAILARRLGQAHDPRLVSGRGEELQETGPRQPRRRGIHERVEIDRIAAHQRLVDDERHPPLAVGDEPEGRQRAGLDAEDQAQLLGRAEGQATGGADRLVQPLEVDAGSGLGDDEEEAALLVLEEQVLRMPARDLVLDRLRFRDREDRDMLIGPRLDAEALKEREEVGGRGGQADGSGRSRLLAARPRGLKAGESARLGAGLGAGRACDCAPPCKT